MLSPDSSLFSKHSITKGESTSGYILALAMQSLPPVDMVIRQDGCRGKREIVYTPPLYNAPTYPNGGNSWARRLGAGWPSEANWDQMKRKAKRGRESLPNAMLISNF